MSSRDKARYGEQLVASILPDATWLNQDGETNLSHDLTWEGMQINVKYRSAPSYSSPKAFEFSNYTTTPTDNSKKTIYILVGIANGKRYFFIETTHKFAWYKKMEQSIPEHELQRHLRALLVY